MMKELGKLVAFRREERKLSLRDTGALAQVSFETVRLAEQGDADYLTIVHIAKVLGVGWLKIAAALQKDVLRTAKAA